MKKLKLSIALISLCILCACNNKIDDKMQDSTGIQPMTEVNDEGEVIITRGRCGEQANWTYYEETGLLEIYGKGPLWGDIYPDDYTRLRDKNGKILDYPYLAYDRDGVKSIIVAEGITMLPTDIFSNYKSLQEVTIGNDVDFAGGGSFSYCRNLKKVLLPDSMENVLYGMFEGCESLESINIPENARVIYGNAFFGCTALKEIELSDSVRIIEDFAFYGCNNMEKIKMSENIGWVGLSAFQGCSGLSEVMFPNIEGITIEAEAFKGASLEEVTLNKNTIYSKVAFDTGVRVIFFE